MTLVVEAVGPLCLVEDLGRPGYGDLGVSTSGAADREAHALANRLVGNDADAATLEVLMGGLRVRAGRALTVALTGAPVAATVNGRPVSFLAPVHLDVGDVLGFGVPIAGLRTYVAVRGGIVTTTVLGSRASDPTTGLGGAPLRAGDELPIGTLPSTPIPDVDAGCTPTPTTGLTLRAVLGPRDDWFTEAALASFAGQVWEVTAEADRVGVRLTGQSLERGVHDELPSEGTVRGAVQVPKNGQPVVFLADHPTTGGYPVVAVIVDEDVDRLAQARPGTRVRFRCERRSVLT